jgi:hypothetical protein
VLQDEKPGEYFDMEYPIPEKLTRGRRKVSVELRAEPGATAGGVFDVRILKTRKAGKAE